MSHTQGGGAAAAPSRGRHPVPRDSPAWVVVVLRTPVPSPPSLWLPLPRRACAQGRRTDGDSEAPGATVHCRHHRKGWNPRLTFFSRVPPGTAAQSPFPLSAPRSLQLAPSVTRHNNSARPRTHGSATCPPSGHQRRTPGTPTVVSPEHRVSPRRLSQPIPSWGTGIGASLRRPGHPELCLSAACVQGARSDHTSSGSSPAAVGRTLWPGDCVWPLWVSGATLGLARRRVPPVESLPVGPGGAGKSCGQDDRPGWRCWSWCRWSGAQQAGRSDVRVGGFAPAAAGVAWVDGEADRDLA